MAARISAWSRTADISGSTTITFPVVKALEFNELSFLVESDRDGKLTVEQGVDGSGYEITDHKYHYGGVTSDFKIPVHTEYARLKYENTSASDTNGFKLQGYGRTNGSQTIYNSSRHVVFAGTPGGAGANLSVNGGTASVDVEHLKLVDIYGATDPSTSLVVQLSWNDSNFYDSIHTVEVSGQFHIPLETGAKFLKLRNLDQDTSIVAIMSGKY